jgi:hypothetical protein
MTNHRAQRRKQQQAQFPHRQRKSVGRAPLAASALVLAWGSSVQAATFTVTNTFDGGEGSLRNAIAAANSTLGADDIVFNLTTPATINLTTGELTITDVVTITGLGADVLTLNVRGRPVFLRLTVPKVGAWR